MGAGAQLLAVLVKSSCCTGGVSCEEKWVLIEDTKVIVRNTIYSTFLCSHADRPGLTVELRGLISESNLVGSSLLVLPALHPAK